MQTAIGLRASEPRVDKQATPDYMWGHEPPRKFVRSWLISPLRVWLSYWFL